MLLLKLAVVLSAFFSSKTHPRHVLVPSFSPQKQTEPHSVKRLSMVLVWVFAVVVAIIIICGPAAFIQPGWQSRGEMTLHWLIWTKFMQCYPIPNLVTWVHNLKIAHGENTYTMKCDKWHKLQNFVLEYHWPTALNTWALEVKKH